MAGNGKAAAFNKIISITELLREESSTIFTPRIKKRFTMGPQVVLGIEYAYFQLPLSAFLEVEFFTDVQAYPGWHRFEGGAELRYIF